MKTQLVWGFAQLFLGVVLLYPHSPLLYPPSPYPHEIPLFPDQTQCSRDFLVYVYSSTLNLEFKYHWGDRQSGSKLVRVHMIAFKSVRRGLDATWAGRRSYWYLQEYPGISNCLEVPESTSKYLGGDTSTGRPSGSWREDKPNKGL